MASTSVERLLVDDEAGLTRKTVEEKLPSVKERVKRLADTEAVRNLSAEGILEQERDQHATELPEGVSRELIPVEDGVSGDYSAIKKTERGLFIDIEDHAGHGVSGAALRRIAHTPTSIDEDKAPLTPGAYIKRLHDRMKTHLKGRSTVAASAFEILQGQNAQEIRYAGRGNMFMLVDGKTGKVKNVISPELKGAIGVALVGEIEEKSIGYENGDIFIAGTDGLWELKNNLKEGTAAGLKALQSTIETAMESSVTKSAEDVREAILKAIEEGGQTDDVTLITIKL